MKILQLVAENVKKLRAVEITPDGALVEITGKNGAGKSSVLDSIWWALAGTKNIQAAPIRKGEDKARIRLDLGELVVERRFTPNGSTLTVSNAEGARYGSPQTMLDALLGALSFDPLAFVGQEPKQQFATLRQIVDVGIDLEGLDALNRRDTDVRAELNRKAKSVRAQVEAMPRIDKDPGLPVNVDDLLGQMANASMANAKVAAELRRRDEILDHLKIMVDRVDRLKRDLAAAEGEVQDLDNEIKEWGPPDPMVDVQELRAGILKGQEHNRMVEAWGRRAELIKQAKGYEDQSEALTDAMKARAEEKDRALAAVKMPVDGLELGEECVLFNGVPLDQASSAEQLRVSVGLAMAANPKLRVLRIKEGSLLDADNLAMIAQMAEERDYQVWVERVDSSGRIGFVIEDGQVAAEPVTP